MSADVNGLDALLHSEVDEKTLKEITGDLRSQLNPADRSGFMVGRPSGPDNSYQFANGNGQFHRGFGHSPSGFDGGGWNDPAISVASTSAASLFNSTPIQSPSDRLAQVTNGPTTMSSTNSAAPNPPRFKVVAAPSVPPVNRPPSQPGNFRLPRPNSNEGVAGPTAMSNFSGDFNGVSVKTETRSNTPVSQDSSAAAISFNGQTGSYVTVSSTNSSQPPNGSLTPMFNLGTNRTSSNSLLLPTSCSNSNDNSGNLTANSSGGGAADNKPLQPYSVVQANNTLILVQQPNPSGQYRHPANFSQMPPNSTGSLVLPTTSLPSAPFRPPGPGGVPQNQQGFNNRFPSQPPQQLAMPQQNGAPGVQHRPPSNMSGQMGMPRFPQGGPDAIGNISMVADDAKKKCRNFLSTLIQLAEKRERETADGSHTFARVIDLIQKLVNNAVPPREFTQELERVLRSQPQPHLLAFLERNLPELRVALHTGEMVIERISPPSAHVIAEGNRQQQLPQTSISAQTPALMHQLQQQPGLVGMTTPRHISPGGSSTSSLATPTQYHQPSRSAKSPRFNNSTPATPDKYKDTADDDINDVAQMAGVNLAEESQKILASTSEILSTETRSCRDEYFLYTTPLMQKISLIAKECGLEDPCVEVANLISHSTQERLRDLVEKLAITAGHRMDLKPKLHSLYSQTTDVKGQLRFLESLDEIEKNKAEEREKELLIKLSKSRSKSEDPEKEKMKAKAKEIQKAEQNEKLNKDANEAAQLALASYKKRPRLDPNASGDSSSSQFPPSVASSSSASQPFKPRVKRVNLRDLQFVMQQEKDPKLNHNVFKLFFSK